MNDTCKTKYPVVLIHGAGFRDLKWPVYWGRIPAALERRGAQVFYGLQDCWGSTETNAAALAARIDTILLETGAERVHLIGHSKGGLDARMAASGLGCAEKIASITTVCTPHRGSKTVDMLFALPRPMWNTAAFAVNNWIRVVGDKRPEFQRLCEDLTTARAAQFNAENPDVPDVLYRSYACVMGHPFSDINLSTANAAVDRIEGENDGLVTVDSALWGTEKHILRSNAFRGISHVDAIDLRRAPFTKKPGDGVSDVCDVYVDMVRALKERGM